MSAAVLFHLALAAYSVAAVLYVSWLVRPEGSGARRGFWAMGAGAALHALSLIVRGEELLHATTLSLAEALSFLSFFVVVGFLLLDRKQKLPVIGAFIAPMVLAVVIPAHIVPIERARPGPIVGFVLPLHVGVSIAGVALFGLGFGTAVMYLLLERELKQKRLGTFFKRLPSLEVLDRLTFRMVAYAFASLTVALVTGAGFLRLSEQSGPAILPKIAFAVLAWGVAAALIVLRRATGWRGRKVALATAAGFAFGLSAYAMLFLGGTL